MRRGGAARAGKERPDHCRQQDADDSGSVMHAIGVVGDHRDTVGAGSNPQLPPDRGVRSPSPRQSISTISTASAASPAKVPAVRTFPSPTTLTSSQALPKVLIRRTLARRERCPSESKPPADGDGSAVQPTPRRDALSRHQLVPNYLARRIAGNLFHDLDVAGLFEARCSVFQELSD
jgi:hypothetical protein